jgi:hypothetical protein
VLVHLVVVLKIKLVAPTSNWTRLHGKFTRVRNCSNEVMHIGTFRGKDGLANIDCAGMKEQKTETLVNPEFNDHLEKNTAERRTHKKFLRSINGLSDIFFRLFFSFSLGTQKPRTHVCAEKRQRRR